LLIFKNLQNEKVNVFITLGNSRACEKNSISASPNSVNQTISFKAGDQTYSSIYKDYYDHFLSSELGELDESPTNISVDGDTISIFSSESNHPENSSIPLANFISYESSSGNITAVIQDYSAMEFSDGIAIGGNISIKLVNGLEIYKISKSTNNKWVLEDGDDLPIVSQLGISGWWTCTTDCYAYAKNACAGDPDCDLLCDLANIVGYCTITIGTACGIHCATNSTFTPPTQLYLLSELDPYGFGN
jgi:hypothetical protein